jgi:hypothetical protein
VVAVVTTKVVQAAKAETVGVEDLAIRSRLPMPKEMAMPELLIPEAVVAAEARPSMKERANMLLATAEAAALA